MMKNTHPIKNQFSLYQVKKMIGKKLIVLPPNLVMTIQDKNNAKLLKQKIIESGKKNLILTVMCNQGIMFLLKNIDIFMAINSISYKELENDNINNIIVNIIQYPKLTKNEIHALLK